MCIEQACNSYLSSNSIGRAWFVPQTKRVTNRSLTKLLEWKPRMAPPSRCEAQRRKFGKSCFYTSQWFFFGKFDHTLHDNFHNNFHRCVIRGIRIPLLREHQRQEMSGPRLSSNNGTNPYEQQRWVKDVVANSPNKSRPSHKKSVRGESGEGRAAYQLAGCSSNQCKF